VKIDYMSSAYWGRLIVGLSIVVSLSLINPAAAQTPSLVISTPQNGAPAASGQALAITVTVASGSYPSGIAIFAQDPLGIAALQAVVGSAVNFAMTIPANTPPGTYAITAVGQNSAGTLVSSTPVNVVVERADLPTSLIVTPTSVVFGYIGDKVPLTLIGTFAAGVQMDVTQSSHLSLTSENTSIAGVKNGVITAVGTGNTTIDVQYGSVTGKIAVTVPAGIPGDLNGDGVVNCADLAIIKASFGKSFGQAGFNIRADLNGDGVVNILDLSMEARLMPAGTVCN
jgi:hypothetical protein